MSALPAGDPRGAGDAPVAFYDGGCPLCRREVAHYRRIDRAGRIRWIDIHARPAELAPYGLSWQATMRRMHVVESDGRVVTGARAFVALWRRLPRYRLLAWLVSLPGVFRLAEIAYSLFARWRWRSRCDQLCERPDS
jgi:predicted DCC family thiol-disulfide oxidoreductase YuxK